MAPNSRQSRRAFVRQVGAATGVVALSSGSGVAAARFTGLFQQREASSRSPYSTLSRRTCGWLRFLWGKATTPDDWSSGGVPHQWWDVHSNPVVNSYGRFELQVSSYALLLMADQTPAWREVYTRIADGLASRFPTHWRATDWLTQIGDDPKRANYPKQDMALIPERI